MKRKKRKNNEGSWGEKTIHGKKYLYFKKTYILSDGTKDEKYYYGATVREINEKKEEYETNLSRPSKKDTIFGDYITNWLYSEKADTLSPGSFDGYERAINVRIRDFKLYDLWNKQLSQIDHDAKTGIEIFKCYVEALRDSGYARKTISEITGIISQCLKYASSPLRRDLKYNYMEYVTLPTEENVKKHRREIHFMNEEELDKLYHECKRINEKFEGGTGPGKLTYSNNGYAIIIIMYTGLRVSELCALKWSDVDFANARIWIHRSLRMIKNRAEDGGTKTILIEKETKTKNGRRFITITSRVREALQFFLQFKTSEDGYVCVNKNMNPVRRERLWRSLNRMLKNAGMNHYTIHELRHSFGSLLLEKSDNQDRAIAAISRILGHANVNITYNIYIHILDARLTTTFQILDDYTVENAFTGCDIETDSNEADTNISNDNDNIDYKEKYEELKQILMTLSMSA